jgi:periplasmic divalent cation tolerance protein
MKEICLITFSYPNDGRKLKKLVQSLVLSWKVACIQVTNYVHSYYMREGKLTKKQEKLVTCKLLESNSEIVLWLIKNQHPYEIPEILVEKKMVNDEYAHWVEESSKNKKN